MRLQRYPDGSTWQDVPGWFKAGFIFDPWGTRIELIEDADHLGFHHVHLSATDPAATLAWYRDVLGGEDSSLSGQNAVQFGDVWVLAMEHPAGVPAATNGRAIDHIAFAVSDLDDVAGDMRGQGVEFAEAPSVPDNARASARRAFVVGPDNVKLALVESGWAGVVLEAAALGGCGRRRRVIRDPKDSVGRTRPARGLDRQRRTRHSARAAARSRGRREPHPRGSGGAGASAARSAASGATSVNGATPHWGT